MPGVKQTQSDLLIHLQEQVDFLRTSCDSFDNGKLSEAKRIAVVLRILLHDTRDSISLLGQLNLKNIDFFSTTHGISGGELLSIAALLIIEVGPQESRYIVPFEDRPPHQFSWMSFDNWWNQNVFLDNKRRMMSRKKLVTYVANQDGGAHVDPDLDEIYYELTRQDSVAWLDSRTNTPIGPNPALLSIRQIAFELLKTLENQGIK